MIDRIKQLLEPEVSLSAKLIGISLFLGKMFESHDSSIVDLEARQLQEGDKGDKGERGEKGERGADGPQGVAGQAGAAGNDGKDGKDGKQGKQGVSIVDAEIAVDDHLVLKLSNGKEIDAGELPVRSAEQMLAVSGNAGQITVATTAPSNPQINQLWYDIS